MIDRETLKEIGRIFDGLPRTNARAWEVLNEMAAVCERYQMLRDLALIREGCLKAARAGGDGAAGSIRRAESVEDQITNWLVSDKLPTGER